jgi:hypothetical protein
MNVHSIVVFLHVLGVLVAFTAVGVELVALPRFRRAAARSEASTWVHLMENLGRAHGATFVVLLGSGIFLMLKYWHHQPWIDVGVLGLVTMAGLGGGVTGRMLRGIAKDLVSGADSDLSPAIRALQTGPLLVRSLRLRVSLGVSMVAVMTLKPGYVGCLVIVAATIVLGWLIGMRAGKATS